MSKKTLVLCICFLPDPTGVKTTHFADDSHYYICRRLFAALRPSAPSNDRVSDSVHRLSALPNRYRRSLGLSFLTLFDVFVVRLTWKEYRKKTLDETKGRQTALARTQKSRPAAARPSPPREEHGMRLETVCSSFSSVLLLSAVLLAGGCAIIRPQAYQSLVTQTPVPANSYLVIGFMGGVEARDADKHAVRKLALKLRSLDLPNVYVETVENGREILALQLIQNALDRNRDGTLDEEERASARVILYGHSLGGVR